MVEGKKIFADKIRMIAKSIYNAADDIAGNTDGCTEISINFTIESENDNADLPAYEIVRRHYPERQLVEDFIRMRGATETVEKKYPDPDVYKEMLHKEIEKAKTAVLFPTHVTLSHDEGLRILGKCCATCKYENDIDIPYCNTCSRNPDLVDYRQCSDNWEDFK